MSTQQKVIIIGATSGIGEALARRYARQGYRVGITGRRTQLLEKLAAELPVAVSLRTMDVTKAEAAQQLSQLIDEMGGADIIVINAGIGFLDSSIPWDKELATIDTNVTGFARMANVAFNYFTSQGHGHLVGISSIAALRGGPSPAYNASKAFVSSYLQGLRCLVARKKLPIKVTDVQPGFVDTPMAQGAGLFWVASAGKAAAQIVAAQQSGKKQVYVSRRWRLIAWAMKLMPDAIYHRLL